MGGRLDRLDQAIFYTDMDLPNRDWFAQGVKDATNLIPFIEMSIAILLDKSLGSEENRSNYKRGVRSVLPDVDIWERGDHLTIPE